jgi:hypothetical protein
MTGYGGFEPAVQAAIADGRADAYRDDPESFAARRAADAIAAGVAETVKADIYVTNRDYLHQVSWPLGRGVTFCRPIDALALVGLYLRSQGEFLIWIDPPEIAIGSIKVPSTGSVHVSYFQRDGDGSQHVSLMIWVRRKMTSPIWVARSSSVYRAHCELATIY